MVTGYVDEQSIATRSPKHFTLYKRNSQSVQNVASGARAVATIPIGPTYYKTHLRFLTAAGAECTKAQIQGEITSISVEINGKVHWSPLTPTELNMLSDYYNGSVGGGSRNGYVTLDWVGFNSYKANGEIAQLAIGTADIQNFNIIVNCGTLTNVAQIQVFNEYTQEVRPMGAHIQRRKVSLSHTTTGVDEIELLRQPGFAYKALHFSLGSAPGVIRDFQLERNSFEWLGDTPISLLRADLLDLGRTPQSGYEHIDFAETQELTNFLWTGEAGNPATQSQTLFVKPYWSTAPSAYSYISEELHNFRLPA